MRLILLPLILLAVLAPALFLEQDTLKPSALKVDAPERIGAWKSFPFLPSDEERKVLASDTAFVKSFYVASPKTEPEKLIKLQCSMVFSGHDVNNSIHQPEICLPAQGHFDMQNSSRFLEMPLKQTKLPIQRIRSKVTLNPTKGKKSTVVNSLSYYFFVGHSTITHLHSQRSIRDIKDRLYRGYDQQWAFVILSIPFGKHPDPRVATLTEQQADKILSNFSKDLVNRSVRWEMIEEIIH